MLPTTGKRKHVTLTLRDKLDMIQALRAGESRTTLANRFNVGLTTISDISRRSAAIQAYAASLDSEDRASTRKSMKKPTYLELEEAIYMWVKEMRAFGQPINRQMICEKARLYNEKLNGDPCFKASVGWLDRFRIRKGLRDLYGNGSKADSNEDPPTFEAPARPMMSDEDIIQQCLITIKTEATANDVDDNDANDNDASDNKEYCLDSTTGFIRRKKRKRPTPKPKPNTSIEDMKRRKLALEIEQLELRNHLCRIEIFQAEKSNGLMPSVHTETLHQTQPITEVYVENGETF